MNPAKKIIQRLGGLTKTAAFLTTPEKEMPITTVQSWAVRGKIPQEHWVALIEAGKTIDETIELADFLGLPVEMEKAS
jgi:hypothetical protein